MSVSSVNLFTQVDQLHASISPFVVSKSACIFLHGMETWLTLVTLMSATSRGERVERYLNSHLDWSVKLLTQSVAINEVGDSGWASSLFNETCR